MVGGRPSVRKCVKGYSVRERRTAALLGAKSDTRCALDLCNYSTWSPFMPVLFPADLRFSPPGCWAHQRLLAFLQLVTCILSPLLLKGAFIA